VRFFSDAQYTLVEPQDFLKKHVQDLVDRGYKIKWISAGAGDAPGELAFTLANRDDSSTFDLTEEEAKLAGFRQVLIEVKTLNEIVRSAGRRRRAGLESFGWRFRPIWADRDFPGRGKYSRHAQRKCA